MREPTKSTGTDYPASDTPMSPQGRLAFLDGIRGVAIALVVAVHAVSYVGLSLPSSSVRYSVMFALAVPPFFTVDGFLFCHRMAKRLPVSHGAYLTSSAQRLLLPWLVFSVLYLVLRGIFESITPSAERIVLGQSPGGLLMQLYTSAAAPQLYFLPSLFLIRALAPLSLALFRAHICILLFLLGVYTALFGEYLQAAYLDLFRISGLDPVLHALWGVQYYLLGITLFRVWSHIERHPIAVSTGFVLLAPLFLAHPSLKILFQFALIAGLFSLMWVVSHRVCFLSRVGRHTMGIYLVHAPVPIKLFQLVSDHVVAAGIAFPFVWTCSLLTSLFLAVSIGNTRFGRFILGLPRRSHSPAAPHTATDTG